MPGPLQWLVRLEFHAPLAEVWEAIEDVSLIPRYHPEVRAVVLLSGSSRRAPGMRYKCVVPTGRRAGWCVEQVVEHVPMERTTVAFPEDSWGLSRLLADFTTELSVAADANHTQVQLAAYYRPRSRMARVLNAVGLRRVMRRRARRTLERLGRLVEERHAPAPRRLLGNSR